MRHVLPELTYANRIRLVINSIHTYVCGTIQWDLVLYDHVCSLKMCWINEVLDGSGYTVHNSVKEECWINEIFEKMNVE